MSDLKTSDAIPNSSWVLVYTVQTSAESGDGLGWIHHTSTGGSASACSSDPLFGHFSDPAGCANTSITSSLLVMSVPAIILSSASAFLASKRSTSFCCFTTF
eukprot:scaffold154393_cov54-Attheya_sp.AAC.6